MKIEDKLELLKASELVRQARADLLKARRDYYMLQSIFNEDGLRKQILWLRARCCEARAAEWEGREAVEIFPGDDTGKAAREVVT